MTLPAPGRLFFFLCSKGRQITLSQAFFLTVIIWAGLCIVLCMGKDDYSISVKQEEKDCPFAIMMECIGVTNIALAVQGGYPHNCTGLSLCSL